MSAGAKVRLADAHSMQAPIRQRSTCLGALISKVSWLSRLRFGHKKARIKAASWIILIHISKAVTHQEEPCRHELLLLLVVKALYLSPVGLHWRIMRAWTRRQ